MTADQAPQKRPAVFGTVEQLRPDTRGHNLVVKVREVVPRGAPPHIPYQAIASKMVLNKQGGRGSTRIAEVLLGDATGVIVFSAKNEQVDTLTPGKYAVLRNARVDMFKGSMRLVVDQWGKVEAAEDDTVFEPKVCPKAKRATFTTTLQQEDNNLSLIEFELVRVPDGSA